jgi:hypothetical protein
MQNSYCDHRNFESVNQIEVKTGKYKQEMFEGIDSCV